MTTAIFIPTFKRPAKLAGVIKDIITNTDEPIKVYFIVEKEDQGSIDELKRLNATCVLNRYEPCYAGAINTAYEVTDEPIFFTGADDLNFHKGWLSNALSHLNEAVKVVGTNDMGAVPIGPQRDATHYLVDREYIRNQSGRVDCPDMVLYPYKHNYTDKEFVETAQVRGVYAYCPESLVEHMHWAWQKAKMDETYLKGFESNSIDQQTFNQRRHLWQR